MSDSNFIGAFNQGNDAFAVDCAEQFTVATGSVGVPGTYWATTIDDLASALAVAPGGLRGDNTVNVFISRTVKAASAIVDGSILVVRGKRVRVNSIDDDGDNQVMLSCGSAGIKLSL